MVSRQQSRELFLCTRQLELFMINAIKLGHRISEVGSLLRQKISGTSEKKYTMTQDL